MRLIPIRYLYLELMQSSLYSDSRHSTGVNLAI